METNYVIAKDNNGACVGKFYCVKFNKGVVISSFAFPTKDTYNVTIPNKINGVPVTSIGDYAFSGCTGLTSITIPDSVAWIGYKVFLNCTSLTNINIPSSVTSIGAGAFEGCKGLKEMTVPGTIYMWDAFGQIYPTWVEKVTVVGDTIGDGAFSGCEGLTSITIASSVKNIGKRAFHCCRGLKSIPIPDSVTNIGYSAFRGCSKLRTFKGKYFKATDINMCCRGFKYGLNKTFVEEKADLCECGFHACKSPLDIFNYYSGEIGRDIRLFEVELKDVSRKRSGDSKRVGKKIKFIRELTISELARLASGGEV